MTGGDFTGMGEDTASLRAGMMAQRGLLQLCYGAAGQPATLVLSLIRPGTGAGSASVHARQLMNTGSTSLTSPCMLHCLLHTTCI
jgi:hypothetical protein